MDANITQNENQEHLSFKTTPENRKALEMGSITIGGFLAGLGTMALLGHSKSAQANNAEFDYDESCDGDDMVEIITDIPVAQYISEDMTFDEAFSAARSELGAGGFFNWHGRSYNTYYADEWTEMDSVEQSNFLASVEDNATYKTYDYQQSINIDGDTQSEITLADVDHDGDIDVKEVDLNNDGNVDIIHVAPDDITVVENNEENIESQEIEEMAADSGEEVFDPVMGQLDTNGNEIVDSIAYDRDLDGYADTVIIDINEDGYGDIAGIDTDLDGELDIVVIDENQDGFDENDSAESIEVEIAMDEFIIVDSEGEAIVQDVDDSQEISDDEDLLGSIDDFDDSELEMI